MFKIHSTHRSLVIDKGYCIAFWNDVSRKYHKSYTKQCFRRKDNQPEKIFLTITSLNTGYMYFEMASVYGTYGCMYKSFLGMVLPVLSNW